ncbi:MAG: helix-turn-helix domain-containing protein [Pseudonocardiaceae bacterium]
MDELAGMTTGQRVRYFRQRAGMTRAVLGGLVGRSDEWVKAVETDRLLTPRIPLLLRLAEVLKVDDLAQLTGRRSYPRPASPNPHMKRCRKWQRRLRRIRFSLPDGYVHPYLIFGTGMVGAYAITLHADLMHGREAIRAADQSNPATMPSVTRRSFHSIETARAYHLQREPVAVVHLLHKAYDESPDAARFNGFARSAVTELLHRGGNTIRADVDDLARKFDITV